MSKIQFKRGLEANRTGQSPAFVPDAGEPIWATDTNKLYVGDGSTEGGVEVGVPATATRTVTEFTATASQTDFTGLSYEVGYVDVHYNGSQLESTEFTATNGTSITLTTPATAGALVRVTAWKLVEFLASGITTEEFTMTGGETSITTNYDVGAIRFLRSGTLQASADFTATNGTSISFSPAAFAGELITVEKIRQITDSLGSADIGVTVQAYDADTAKYDDVTANFTGTLQNGGSNVVVDSDIGVTVQAYDATILNSADIGVNVQAYDATILNSADIGVTVQGYDATLLNDADIGASVQAYDSNLTSFVGTFTLPTTDGTADQVLKTNGSGTLSFADAVGAWEYVSTTTASNTTGVSFTLSGGALYVVLIKDMFGDYSGNGTLDVDFPNLTSSLYGYSYSVDGVNSGATNQPKAVISEARLGTSAGTDYGHTNGLIYINAGGGGQYPSVWYNGSLPSTGSGRPENASGAGHYRNASATGTSVNISSNGGNISGTFIFYKIIA